MAQLSSTKQRGRQRSDQTTKKIQTAALRLARELGPANVTIENISAASEVAKTTIYRRWPNAAAVIMDAFLTDIDPLIRYRPAATLEDTMELALADFARSLSSERRALLCHLIGSAQSDAELAAAFLENWIYPRRQAGLAAIGAFGRSMEEGEEILDLLFGAFYYRLLIPYKKIDAEWIRSIVKRVI